MMTPKCLPLLTKIEVENIFQRGELYEKHSFYFIEKGSKTYNTEIRFESFVHYACEIRNNFLKHQTILVKNLEKFNEKIYLESQKLGENVDVHMYLAPEEGSDSFDFHQDFKDVLIVLIYGEKEFHLVEGKKTNVYHLSAGDKLFIKRGIFHKAISRGRSCLLSFGYQKDSACIESVAFKPFCHIDSYFIPMGIKMSDL